MARYTYPAVFTPEENGFSIVFPDLEGCYTCGDNIDDALYMAEDVLALTLCDYEDESKEIPKPSDFKNIALKDGDFINYVTCNTDAYRKSYSKNTQVQTKEVITKVVYPVIFTDTKTNILIEIPDLGVLTEANSEGEAKGSLADAIAMARDTIGSACIMQEKAHKELNNPSSIEMIDVSKGVFAKNGRSIVSMVDVDLIAYKKIKEKP